MRPRAGFRDQGAGFRDQEGRISWPWVQFLDQEAGFRDQVSGSRDQGPVC